MRPGMQATILTLRSLTRLLVSEETVVLSIYASLTGPLQTRLFISDPSILTLPRGFAWSAESTRHSLQVQLKALLMDAWILRITRMLAFGVLVNRPTLRTLYLLLVHTSFLMALWHPFPSRRMKVLSVEILCASKYRLSGESIFTDDSSGHGGIGGGVDGSMGVSTKPNYLSWEHHNYSFFSRIYTLVRTTHSSTCIMRTSIGFGKCLPLIARLGVI